MRAIARLRAGTSPDAAQREAATIAARLQEAYPQSNTGQGFAIRRVADYTLDDAQRPLMLLMAMVALLLMIACGNVTNLLLTSGNARRSEFAIRMALGAGRGRLMAQLLTESLLLAVFGATVGFAMAVAGTRAILRFGAHGIPRADTIGIDGAVLAFAVGTTLVTTVLFGLAPALRVAALSARNARDARGASRDRFRTGLVVAETAMAIVVLVAAGLVTKSLWRLGTVDPGMHIEGLLTFRVTPPAGRYPTTDELAPLMTQLEERLAALPDVEGAGIATDLPMSGAVNSVTARRDDLPPPAPGEAPLVLIRAISPTYFSTVGLAMRRGRNVTAGDRMDGEMVMVINARAAELFPGEDPVGHHVTTLGISYRVVGVVGNVRQFGPARLSEPGVYIPYSQIRGNEWLRRSVTFFVRTTNRPLRLGSAIRDAVRAVDPTIPINDIQPMTTVLANNLAGPRFRSLVFGLFGILALGLAAVGLGGVMAFSLSQPSREIAIRLAIGAEPGTVTKLVLSQGARLTMIGTVLGLAVSAWLSQLMAGFLFDVEPHDLSVFATVTAVLISVALLATYLPARRASRLAPAKVLRTD